MRWTSLEEPRRRLAVSYHLQLPALLDRSHTLLRSTAHHLQYHEGEQNEADVANHRLIHPALARLQSRAYCLLSRKSVSIDQRLTLRKTTVVRSASKSLVTMYS